MKASIDSVGRIVVPKALRDALGLAPGNGAPVEDTLIIAADCRRKSRPPVTNGLHVVRLSEEEVDRVERRITDALWTPETWAAQSHFSLVSLRFASQCEPATRREHRRRPAPAVDGCRRSGRESPRIRAGGDRCRGT